jgi:hypothetical protein
MVDTKQRLVEKMKTKKHDAIVLSSSSEKAVNEEFYSRFRQNPLPDDEILHNLGLFLSSKDLSRLLFFYEIYKQIVHSHGVILEFGVRWGQTLSLMAALRGIFEPFNRHRKIIGFDTFEGFRGLNDKDGKTCKCSDGSFSVPSGYEEYLENILSLQEKLNPLAHLKKFELVKGDATKTVPAYFKNHPETIISLAVFDFDIYAPTKTALAAVKPHLCKGAILVFDELCDDIFPGETVALREVFGLNNLKIQRMPMASRLSYIQIK